MFEMPRDPAKWRAYLTESEREELDRAERLRDAAADNLRALVKRLKERCIKRLKRDAD